MGPPPHRPHGQQEGGHHLGKIRLLIGINLIIFFFQFVSFSFIFQSFYKGVIRYFKELARKVFAKILH